MLRLSPSGRRLVYVAGYGEQPPRPIVTVIDEDGDTYPLEPGHHPAWVSAGGVVWSPQEDGSARFAMDLDEWTPRGPYVVPAGNSLAAANGVTAVHRTDPRRVVLSTGRIILGATDPAVSDDGVWLAYLRPDSPHEGVSELVVERADGSIGPRVLYQGAPNRPRFGGTTLAWEIGRGLIAACVDVSNPAVPAQSFALPSAWKIYRPVPVWIEARLELLVLFLADDGERGHIYLVSWTSLRLGEPRGYRLGVSTGSAYDHDARPIAGTPDVVAVCWLDPHGVLDGRHIQISTDRVLVAPPTPPDPPPPPPPPPPPEPEPPTMKDRATFYQEFREINDFYAAEEGLQRPGGMVIGGAADTEAMAAWGYDLLSGRSVSDVKSSIRNSQEWRDKHPQ